MCTPGLMARFVVYTAVVRLLGKGREMFMSERQLVVVILILNHILGLLLGFNKDVMSCRASFGFLRMEGYPRGFQITAERRLYPFSK